MNKRIRKCRLANAEYRNVDLLKHKKDIIDTINKTVPNKNPKVYKDYFSTDALTQSEAVALGRALSKIESLNIYGKTVTTFRLFDGKTYEIKDSSTTQTNNKPKGGRKR